MRRHELNAAASGGGFHLSCERLQSFLEATLSTVAQHVRLLMRRHGIVSVNELSKRSGITLSALQALVNGTSNPRASTLRALGSFFGVNPRDLVSDLAGTDTAPVLLQSTAQVMRYLMNDVCVSERELAELTGVSQKTINNLLLGRTATPADTTLAPVAEFFSVTLAQLRAEQPLDRQRRKGESNEHLLRTHRVRLIPWSRLPLLPDSLADDSQGHVQTTLSESSLYATKVGNFRAMAPIVRADDVLIVDYAAEFSTGEIFLVQAVDHTVMVGNYISKQQREMLHFCDPKFEPVSLLKGQYRRLGRVREIRRDD